MGICTKIIKATYFTHSHYAFDTVVIRTRVDDNFFIWEKILLDGKFELGGMHE